MVNIVTSLENLKPDLIDFESYFNITISARDLDSTDLDIMKHIDDAELLDNNLGTIKTKFGITSLRHLSTGCKVVLSYRYIIKNNVYKNGVLDITECGFNALEELFSAVDDFNDSRTIFILRHTDGLVNCKRRKYLVNGVETDELWKEL